MEGSGGRLIGHPLRHLYTKYIKRSDLKLHREATNWIAADVYF